MRVLRKFSALATALRHRKAMFVPEDDPTRYTARSSGDAETERAVMELAVEGELAPRPFAVTADHLAALVNAMPEWQPSVSLNTLLSNDREIEALMIWAGERVTTIDAYGVARTLPRRD